MASKKNLIAVVILLAGCSLFASLQVPVRNEGDVLVDGKGMTLYTFDRDPAGKSACAGPCAVNWPPLIATSDAKSAGDYSLVVRDDGQKQWAYKEKPLYLRAQDRQPGDRSGHGVDNLWRIARP